MLAERVVEWTKTWQQQGIETGRLQGRLEGRLEGEQSLLVRQLRKRFGPLDAATEARLQAASTAEIERWAERILEARQLADVFTEETDEHDG